MAQTDQIQQDQQIVFQLIFYCSALTRLMPDRNGPIAMCLTV